MMTREDQRTFAAQAAIAALEGREARKATPEDSDGRIALSDVEAAEAAGYTRGAEDPFVIAFCNGFNRESGQRERARRLTGGLSAEDWMRKAEAAADVIGDLLDVGNIRLLYGDDADGSHLPMFDGITPSGIDNARLIKACAAAEGIVQSIPSRTGGGFTDLRVAAAEAEDRAEAEGDC